MQKENNFKKSIHNALENASEEDRKIMVESLQKLKIDYKLKQANNKIVESVALPKENNVAEDNGAYLVGELQKAVKKNKELTESLAVVQEKLSVCYAKEAKYEALIEKLKNDEPQSNKEEINALKSEVQSLTEQLNEKKELLEKLNSRFSKMSESNLNIKRAHSTLNESLQVKESELNSLKSKVETLKENLRNEEEKSQALEERLEENGKNIAIKSKEYNQKVAKANQLIEHYKKIAQTSVNRYLESKAKFLGVSADTIKSKLNESYTFDDIDRVCNEFQDYQVTASKLPFTLQQKVANNRASVKITESIEPIRPKGRFDDDVDDSLLRMAGLK